MEWRYANTGAVHERPLPNGSYFHGGRARGDGFAHATKPPNPILIIPAQTNRKETLRTPHPCRNRMRRIVRQKTRTLHSKESVRRTVVIIEQLELVCADKARTSEAGALLVRRKQW